MKSSSASVLIVCLANACRSPLATTLLRDRLASADPAVSLQVGSAGVAVERGGARCEWSLAKGRRVVSATSTTARSKRDVDPAPRLVTRADLARTTLILGADREVVSALIRQAPAARERVFTIKEAAALARLAVADAADGSTPRGARDTNQVFHGGLARLVAEMNASRGWLPVERQNRSWRFGRSRSWSKMLDVPDAHSADHRIPHATMYNELAPAIEALVGSLVLVSRGVGTAG